MKNAQQINLVKPHEEFTKQEMQLVLGDLVKELEIALLAGEKTTLTTITAAIVEAQKIKIEEGSIDSQNPEQDIKIANSILEKLAKLS